MCSTVSHLPAFASGDALPETNPLHLFQVGKTFSISLTFLSQSSHDLQYILPLEYSQYYITIEY